jgi:tetratricopeptide (TPR) repeat protein
MNQKASRLPGLMSAYQLYLIDGDSAAFIKSIGSRYSLSTLHRLASAESPIVRRAAVLAVSFLGSRESLQVIGPLLADSDRRVRMVADDAFKSLWYRTAEPRARCRLDHLLNMIEGNRMQESVEVADEIVAIYPELPEGHCRRALVNFNLGFLEDAIRDCETCLHLSPYHYMAYIGLGQCRLEQDAPHAALEAFRRAFEIFPDLEAVRLQIKRLERMLRETT